MSHEPRSRSEVLGLLGLIGVIASFLLGLFLGRKSPRSTARIHNVGTDPIMLNMIKTEVEVGKERNGGAFVAYLKPSPVPTLQPEVAATITGTSSANNPKENFEAVIAAAASPVDTPQRVRKTIVVRMKADLGITLTETTKVFVKLEVKEDTTVLRSSTEAVTFLK